MNDTVTYDDQIEIEEHKDFQTNMFIEKDLKYYKLETLVEEEHKQDKFFKNDRVKEEYETFEDNRRKRIKLEADESLSSFGEEHTQCTYGIVELQPTKQISLKEEIVVKEEYDSSEEYTDINSVNNSEDSVSTFECYGKENSNSSLKKDIVIKEEIDTFDYIQENHIKLEIEDSFSSFDEHMYKKPFEEEIRVKEEYIPERDIKLETSESLSSFEEYSLEEEIILKDELIDDTSDTNFYEEDEIFSESNDKVKRSKKTNKNINKKIKAKKSGIGFACSICEKTFVHKTNLIRHKQIHKNKSFSCKDCKKTFTRSDYLQKHVRSVHDKLVNPKTKIKEYHQCTICDKNLCSSSSLAEHNKIHLGIKDHKCEICKKVFRHKGQLNQHLRVHTDVRKFTCSFCNKKFKHRTHCVEHEKIHTDTRDFECKVCFKSFIRKRHLRQHENVHNKPGTVQSKIKNKRDFECPQCDKVYVYNTTLLSHIRKEHSNNVAVTKRHHI